MYEKLKFIVDNSCDATISYTFNNDNNEMHVKLPKGAEYDCFIKLLIQFTLEDAISTGSNQIFLFSSSVQRDGFRHQMIDLANSLGERLDGNCILSNGAMLSFILISSRTSAGLIGHAYALSYFDDMSFNNFMLNRSLYADRRAVFISIE